MLHNSSQSAYNEIISKVNSQSGAPMGRFSNEISEKPTSKRIFDRSVPLNQGYDKGGAYWGTPSDLRVEFTLDMSYVRFYRGDKPVRVQFLIDTDEENPGNVFAYFPTIVADNKGNKQSYSHIGQHCACVPEYTKECRKAKPEQYADLKNELEQIGYNLKIV